ncbi:MAG: GrpB family protein [Saprospiraceae bacterium]
MLIQKYQESWENDFCVINKLIRKALSNIDIDIEHIGSTSVKNLAAKPIIDIDIVYNNAKSFDNIKLGLVQIGYFHNGDQGIKGREVFKRKDKKHSILDSIQHHLYVCQSNSVELHRHLSFRDYLRNNEKERKEYEAIKYKIAEKANQNQKKYAKMKEIAAKEFINSIIEKQQKNQNQI